MGMWTAITLIVIACVIGETLRKRRDGKLDEDLDTRLQSLETKIDRLDIDLRERIETLERIVTGLRGTRRLAGASTPSRKSRGPTCETCTQPLAKPGDTRLIASSTYCG